MFPASEPQKLIYRKQKKDRNMVEIMLCSVLLCLLIFCGCIYIDESKKEKRKDFLESHSNDRIILFSRKFKLKFILENFPKKEFYIYGVVDSIETKYTTLGKRKIEDQEDLDSYKTRLKTVKDVLDFEKQEEDRMKRINDIREGNYK